MNYEQQLELDKEILEDRIEELEVEKGYERQERESLERRIAELEAKLLVVERREHERQLTHVEELGTACDICRGICKQPGVHYR